MTINDPARRPDDSRPDALPLIPAAPEPEPAAARTERIDPASAAFHDVHAIHDDARPQPRRASAPFMRSHPLHLLSLGFGTGLAPLAPGLIGSLFGWLSFVALAPHLGDGGLALLIAAGFALGVAATGFTARALGGAKPRAIVWDRIVAVWLVMWLVTPAGFAQQLGAFVLLRLVDGVKPPPLRHLDRRLKGGFGIMADDLVAAFVTLFAIAMWQSLFSTSR
ncbi:phosphatidylglycerophosphatase A family protein [Burkholderia sp. Ac-20379]|uniref:phosphatidylglycerophosphatase A family protein n=1 Tax=Burkholderia sp. Ac-20379 TaxID=2703900 RepID=UPI001980B929|nr:phosphatidylglycerophosphatase A [Burkholderia sp. Ac-20379]MBN3728995.1 phosphatidylglycerophosphatase A [Burkholderia sp. Ac-20379]